MILSFQDCKHSHYHYNSFIPRGTWRHNDATPTAMRQADVASPSEWRHPDVRCPVNKLTKQNEWKLRFSSKAKIACTTDSNIIIITTRVLIIIIVKAPLTTYSVARGDRQRFMSAYSAYRIGITPSVPNAMSLIGLRRSTCWSVSSVNKRFETWDHLSFCSSLVS